MDTDTDLTNSPNGGSEKSKGYIPKVDFSKNALVIEGRNEGKLTRPIEEYQEDMDIKFTKPEIRVAKLLESHFLKICAVLSIDLDTTLVDYLFREEMGRNVASHFAKKDRRGKTSFQMVSINFEYLQIAAKKLRDPDSPNIGLMIFAMAHEMYHVRQATFTPFIHADAIEYYIRPSNDFEGYTKQEIEADANKFATKYLEYLISQDDPLSSHFKSYLASRTTP